MFLSGVTLLKPWDCDRFPQLIENKAREAEEANMCSLTLMTPPLPSQLAFLREPSNTLKNNGRNLSAFRPTDTPVLIRVKRLLQARLAVAWGIAEMSIRKHEQKRFGTRNV